MQAYEGYFENGQFYTAGRTIRIPERRRVFLTILEEPPTQLPIAQEIKKEEQLRADWLKRLNTAVNLSSDEELPEFQRSTLMRKPIDLTD